MPTLASFISTPKPWHRVGHDRDRTISRPSLERVVVVGASSGRACGRPRPFASTMRSARWSSSATRSTARTTGRRCRRSCCRVNGSPTGSTCASPRCSTNSTSTGGWDRLPTASTWRRVASSWRPVRSIPFDSLIIATGARPRRLPGQDTFDHVHELRSLDDALALRAEIAPGGRRVVVIGAGFIGLEAAATAKTSGNDVVVLEGASAPLIRGLGAEMGEAIARTASSPRRDRPLRRPHRRVDRRRRASRRR